MWLILHIITVIAVKTISTADILITIIITFITQRARGQSIALQMYTFVNTCFRYCSFIQHLLKS